MENAGRVRAGRPVESLFDVEVKGASKIKAEEQDPRVRTRVITDAELHELHMSGKAPPAVLSSQKKRNQKGGLLGKAGLRGVESTGMPKQLVDFAMATQTAPVVIPVGMLLYGAGSKVETENDPMARQFGFPHSGIPDAGLKQLPDAPPVCGNLSLYRCASCRDYLTKAEFACECVFHPGRYVHKGHSHWAWTCCRSVDQACRGCHKRSTHTEDRHFSDVVRSLGCELSELEMHRQSEQLRQRWPTSYGEGRLAVEVRINGGRETVNLKVLAPPQPSIAAVKTLLQQADQRFPSASTELATTLGGPALRDSSALVHAEGLQSNGFAASDGCTSALVLYTLQTPAQLGPGGAAESEQTVDEDRSTWKRVPLRPGDSLQKLSIKYNLPVATIKSANNIIGAEVEAWRDELWLPPRAEPGQRFQRPKSKEDTFLWLLQGGFGDGHESTKGMQSKLPPREEVAAYICMNNGDVEAAVKEWIADTDWENEQLTATPMVHADSMRKGCASKSLPEADFIATTTCANPVAKDCTLPMSADI